MSSHDSFMMNIKAVKILLKDLGVSSRMIRSSKDYYFTEKNVRFYNLEVLLASFGFELVSVVPTVAKDMDVNIYFGQTIDSEYVICKRNEISTMYYDLNFLPIESINISDLRNVIMVRNIVEQNDSIYSIGKNWFWKLFLQFKTPFLVVFFLSFLLSLTAIIIPVFISVFYSQMIPSIDNGVQISLLIGVVFLIVFNFGIRFFRTLFINRISFRLGSNIVRQVFRRILYLPPSYTEIAPISSQISRIRDFESIRLFLSEGGANYYDLPFTIILIIAMFYFAGSVAWVPVAALVIFFLLGIATYPYIKRYNDHITSTSGQYQQFLLELTTQLRNIKAYHGKKEWPRRFDQSLISYLKNSHRVNLLHSLLNTISTFIVNISGLFTIVLGVRYVIEDEMSSGDLMASLVLVWRILSPIRSGFNSITQVNRVKQSIAQLEKFMTLKQEQKFVNKFEGDQNLHGSIEFNGVSLRYAKESLYALINISFKVNQNETLGIIGHGGCGKSSIVKLILGLYPFPMGRISINDQNITQFNPTRLRQEIGYLEQSPQLLPGTLKENLGISEKKLKSDRIKCIVDILRLDSFFKELPDGLNTDVKDIYTLNDKSIITKLVLLKISIDENSLVLLDEPLKAIARNDHDSILNWVQTLKNRSTMIIISNDPQMLQMTDTALILNKGRIVEIGAPNKLVKMYTLGKQNSSKQPLKVT